MNLNDDLKNLFEKFKPFIIPAIIFLTLLGPRISFAIILIGLLIFIISKYKNNSQATINIRSGEAINSMGKVKNLVLGSIGLILVLWLLVASIVIIDAGEIGVYSLFGKVRDQEIYSGFHLINPLANITRMSIRTENYTMSKVVDEGQKAGDDSISVLTKEGLMVTMDITILYHLDPTKAHTIYKELGVAYEDKIIRPEVRTVIRDTTSQYEAKDIYSEKRAEATQKIKDAIAEKLNPRGIITEDVLVRNVDLPADLAQSIQQKLQAEQEAQKYDFILQKEKKEADRKRIEAAGQRDSQKIINESLTTNYLYYQYISQLKDRQGTIYVPTNPSTGMPQFKELGQ